MAYQFNPFTGLPDLVGITSIPDPLTVDNLTVNTLLTASHIHGNIAGSVYIHVKNLDTVQLSKGTPFYISGTVGASDRVEIKAADNTDPTKSPAIGLVKEDLAVNGEGDGVIIGEIFHYDTLTPGWSTNDPLYVSTAGAITNVEPTSGSRQIIGYVGRVDNQTGTIIVSCMGTDPVAGSNTQIQFNDNGGFGASADLTWDDTAKELGVGGDINLDDGGAFATTLQLITPTANRTISFPDRTGTVALVAGSNRQLIYNNAGAYAGAPSTSVGATGNITLSLAGAASTPPVSLTGTWFSGGTSTTTKPQLLIEPTGTTSTAWNTSGTGLGINAPIGFSGYLLDLQVNGSSVTRVNSLGAVESGNALFYDALAGSNGVFIGSYAGHGILLGSTASFSWTSGNAKGNRDLIFVRDAANIVGQRNGTNAQAYRLYNTFTDASNYERAYLRWASNVLEIGTEGAGTGSENPVRITAARLKLPNLPTYADNAAALTGGLVAGDVYKTATGELRITV